MKKLILLSALILGSLPALASHPEVHCETPRESTKVVLKVKSVSFSSSLEESGRDVASIQGVRTKYSKGGFTKVLFKEGNKYMFHVNNYNSFSELDDYLVIRSKTGHEMTYPLNCSK
ncbi:hypothetical protein OAT67_05225 [Bacteriovoracaceae bacterium]|nr:hypothetical protein [Bacteriovoracaceae bacterium]